MGLSVVQMSLRFNLPLYLAFSFFLAFHLFVLWIIEDPCILHYNTQPQMRNICVCVCVCVCVDIHTFMHIYRHIFWTVYHRVVVLGTMLLGQLFSGSLRHKYWTNSRILMLLYKSKREILCLLTIIQKFSFFLF